MLNLISLLKNRPLIRRLKSPQLIHKSTDDMTTNRALQTARFVLGFGARVFFLWIILTALLAPIWGACMEGLSEAMLRRADFLNLHSIPVSPSISFFKDLSFQLKWGVGVLYGFFFFSLPIAVLLAFFESLAQLLKKNPQKVWLWSFRAIGLCLSLILFCGAFHFYSQSLLWTLWGCFTLALSPLLTSKFMDWSWTKTKKNWSVKKLKFCLVLLTILLSPILTHPTWHILLNTKTNSEGRILYRNSSALTLVRDWLLLDEEGQSTISNFYYKHSPYAAEHERVTVFQPLLVGCSHIDQKKWAPYIRFHFKKNSRDRLQKMNILKIQNPTLALSWLKDESLDILFIHFDKDFKPDLSGIDKKSLYFLSDHKDTPATFKGFSVLNTAKFLSKNSEKVYFSPTINRKFELRKKGFFSDQKEFLEAHRGSLSSFIEGDFDAMLLLFVCVCGVIFYLFCFFMASGKRTPWLLVALLLLYSVSITQSLILNAQTWYGILTKKDSHSVLLQMVHLQEHLENKDSQILENIISKPLHHDSRVAMWQVYTLGHRYRTAPTDLQKNIREYLVKYSLDYHKRPVNYRYKFIECLAVIPEMSQLCNGLLEKESHLYVRWYAENLGLGTKTDPFDDFLY